MALNLFILWNKIIKSKQPRTHFEAINDRSYQSFLLRKSAFSPTGVELDDSIFKLINGFFGIRSPFFALVNFCQPGAEASFSLLPSTRSFP